MKRRLRSTSFRTPKTRLTVLEDDPTNDTLTYSLSGTDAKHFVIVGSVEHPESYDTDGAGDRRHLSQCRRFVVYHGTKTAWTSRGRRRTR